MTTIQLRRGTAAQAASEDPTLASGEIGFETDSGRFKVGDGSTSWNSLPYANDRSRQPITSIAPPYLQGQIAVTRCGQPHTTSTTPSAGAFTGRVAYATGPTGTADLRFCFSNWITLANGATSEGTPNEAGTIKASVEIPQGSGTAFFPIWFRGLRSVKLTDGSEIWSDPVGIEIQAGTTFYVRVLYDPGTSSVYPEANIYSTSADTWVAGDSVDATGALANILGAAGGLYRPTAITCTPAARVPQVVIVGDERAMGNNDPPEYTGYINTALGGNFVSLNLGADQDRASGFAIDHPCRGRFLAGCDYGFETYGGKDLDDSDTLAQIQASRIAIWQAFKQRGIAMYSDTVPPYTTSTDGWTTTTNQTKAWSTANEATRVALNQWMRAGAPMANSAAVTPGTANAIVAGNPHHPLAGVVDDAATCETQVFQYGQGTDSGIWKVGSGGTPLTHNGFGLNAAGCLIAAPSVPVAQLV